MKKHDLKNSITIYFVYITHSRVIAYINKLNINIRLEEAKSHKHNFS